jgi:hypothetical protein
MTVSKLLEAVASFGGVLTLTGNCVEYDLPVDAAHLIDELHLHREELQRVLEHRLAAGVKRWLLAACMSGDGVWAAPKFLHREFVTATAIECTEAVFVAEVLRHGYKLDAGMIEGLALRIDWESITGAA